MAKRAVFWIIATTQRPYSFSDIQEVSFGNVPSAPTTIRIALARIFPIFPNSSARSWYFWYFLLEFYCYYHYHCHYHYHYHYRHLYHYYYYYYYYYDYCLLSYLSNNRGKTLLPITFIGRESQTTFVNVLSPFTRFPRNTISVNTWFSCSIVRMLETWQLSVGKWYMKWISKAWT